MKAERMATRMSVLGRALPSRVLLVDDDELELELMADRLAAAGFEVACAQNGEAALQLIEQQWYPLVITDWLMPVMDGIAFTEALRSRGATDTYIIMLTMREASVDYERGYVAGVDDYLSKRVPDAELFARITAAFNTLALRRSLKEAQAALEQAAAVDTESGAFALRELYTRLHGEIRRAQRYGRKLTLLTLVVSATQRTTALSVALTPEMLRGIVQTIESVVRLQIDWTGRLDSEQGAAFAVVLPESSISEAPRIKERLLDALRRHAEGLETLRLSFAFGVAALDDAGQQSPAIDTVEMLEVAGLCRNCPGRTGPEQLGAVQRSVACHVSIVCRHGYVVDNECSLKARPVARRGSDAGAALVG
jgi:two-component system, cell cycle response regulator